MAWRDGPSPGTDDDDLVLHGAGTLGIEWVDPHVLFSVGYDTNLRMVDTR